MTEINPVGWLQNAGTTHTAEQLRSYLGSLVSGRSGSAGSLIAKGGVNRYLGNQLQVVPTGTPSMAVIVKSGLAVIPGSEGSKQGDYFCLNDGDVTLSIGAAHATLNRIDLVVAKVQDSVYSGATNAWSLAVVAGTAASSPAAPTAPANSITLGQVSIVALDTAINTGDITDKRTYLAAIGGVRICTSTTRPTDINSGEEIYETDTGLFYFYTGAAWLRRNPIAASANRSAAKSISTGVSTAIDFDTEVLDQAAMVNLGANATRITFTEAGIYIVTANGGFVQNATGARDFRVRLNGTTTIAESSVRANDANNTTSASTVCIYSFAVNDYIELMVAQDSGGSLNTTTGVTLSLSVVSVSRSGV